MVGRDVAKVKAGLHPALQIYGGSLVKLGSLRGGELLIIRVSYEGDLRTVGYRVGGTAGEFREGARDGG